MKNKKRTTNYPSILVGTGGSTPAEVDEHGKWVTWEEWFWKEIKSNLPAPDPIPRNTTHLRAVCGPHESRVHLKFEDPRWQMYVATFPAGELVRRRDYASYDREHAQRTAEFWYGPTKDGWHIEATAKPAGPIEEDEPTEGLP